MDAIRNDPNMDEGTKAAKLALLQKVRLAAMWVSRGHVSENAN